MIPRARLRAKNDSRNGVARNVQFLRDLAVGHRYGQLQYLCVPLCVHVSAGSGSVQHPLLCQKTRLSLQPLADDASVLCTVGRPCFWKHVVGDLVGLYAKRVLDDLGGVGGIVRVDGLFELWTYATLLLKQLAIPIMAEGSGTV